MLGLVWSAMVRDRQQLVSVVVLVGEHGDSPYIREGSNCWCVARHGVAFGCLWHGVERKSLHASFYELIMAKIKRFCLRASPTRAARRCPGYHRCFLGQ